MKITTSHYRHPPKDLWEQVFPILAVSLPVYLFRTRFLGYIPRCRPALGTLAGLLLSGYPLVATPSVKRAN